MQRRTCRVPLGLPVLHISSRWRLALFLHASLVESGTERERERKREREGEGRRCGGAGSRLSAKEPNRKLVSRARSFSITLRGAGYAAIARTTCTQQTSARSFRNGALRAVLFHLFCRRTLLLLRPPSYPSRWMHTRRHGPPITKSMAAPHVYRLTFVVVAFWIKWMMICRRKNEGRGR